jgi:hypothetical protein
MPLRPCCVPARTTSGVNGTAHTRGIACATVVCAMAIAACGSERADSTGPRPATDDQALSYVRCLRSHGVPSFPDPSPGGRLPNIPSSIDPAAPAFRSAQRACARLEPGANGSGPALGSSMARLLIVARCMRRNGLPNFPDPTATPPPAPSPDAATGNVIGGPGGYLQLPPQSPALARAASACGFGLG